MPPPRKLKLTRFARLVLALVGLTVFWLSYYDDALSAPPAAAPATKASTDPSAILTVGTWNLEWFGTVNDTLNWALPHIPCRPPFTATPPNKASGSSADRSQRGRTSAASGA